MYCDTETTGLQWYRDDRPFLVGLWHQDRMTVGPPSDPAVTRILGDSSTTKVFHNAPFDVHMLRVSGVEVAGPIEDTMHLAHLLGQERLGLKDLGQSILGQPPSEERALKEWMKKHKLSSYADVPMEIMLPYLKKDVVLTRDLHRRFLRTAGTDTLHQYELECLLIPIIIEMERVGMRVDVPYFEAIAEKTTAEIEDHTYQLQKKTWEDFNHRSPKQLQELVFERLGLPILKKTEKGNPSLDSNTLLQYEHPILDSIIDLRQREKMLSTYYEGILSRQVDGRLHPSIRQNGARTGRPSCSNPNLLNIPRKDTSVRRGFICDEDRVLLFFDYDQVEMRLFAHYSGDRSMQEAILRGEDPHENTAVEIFGPKAEGSKGYRQAGKTFNFGSIYGMGKRKVVSSITKLLRDEVGGVAVYDEDEAEELLTRYHQKNPSVKRFMRKMSNEFEDKGYITDIFKKRYYPDQPHKAVNYLIQGTAAQVMKRAMVGVWDSGLPVRILNSIYDELVLDISKKDLDKRVLNEVKYIMEDQGTFKVPLTVGSATSRTNWADKKE